jgi:hypothetical protein
MREKIVQMHVHQIMMVVIGFPEHVVPYDWLDSVLFSGITRHARHVLHKQLVPETSARCQTLTHQGLSHRLAT